MVTKDGLQYVFTSAGSRIVYTPEMHDGVAVMMVENTASGIKTIVGSMSHIFDFVCSCIKNSASSEAGFRRRVYQVIIADAFAGILASLPEKIPTIMADIEDLIKKYNNQLPVSWYDEEKK